MRARGVDLRLAVPVAVAWAATAVLIGMPGALPWAVAALGLLGLGSALLGSDLRARRWRWLLVIALASVTAVVPVSIAAAQAGARHPAVLDHAARAGRQVSAVLVVGETVRDGHPFAATLTEAATGDTTVRGSVPVEVYPPRDGDPSAERIAIGSTIAIRGALAAEDAGESAAYRLFAAGDLSIEDSVERGPPWYLSWADGLRAGFGRLAQDLPGDGAALLPGLAIGDTSAVSDGLDQSMKASSLTHLTAVSGDTARNAGGLKEVSNPEHLDPGR